MSDAVILSGAELATRLERFRQYWRRGALDDASFAAAYFTLWQIHLYGERFASRRHKNDAKPKAARCLDELAHSTPAQCAARVQCYLDSYRFYGVREAAADALRGWTRQRWPVTVLETIPKPLEVLRMQAAGTRPVTLVVQFPRLLNPVLGKAHGQAFLLHDLEHTYHFFSDPAMRTAQIKLFQRVLAAWDSGLFAPYLHDAEFVRAIHYFMSDMNTHVVHSLRYLVSQMVLTMLRSGGHSQQHTLNTADSAHLAAFLRRLASCWQLDGDSTDALLAMTQPDWGEQQALRLMRAFH